MQLASKGNMAPVDYGLMCWWQMTLCDQSLVHAITWAP